jgi:hypothetical protein
MTQSRNTEFVTVSLTPLGREALRRLTHAMSVRLGRNIPQSEAVIYAEQLLTSKGALERFEMLRGRDS